MGRAYKTMQSPARRVAWRVPKRDGSRPPLPSPARGLDALTILFAVTALVVFIVGGWRLRGLGLVVSLRSWSRPLAWAIVAATVRHVFVPSPSLPRRVADGLLAIGARMASSRWRPAFGAAIGPVAASRGMVYVVGLFAIAAIGVQAGAGHIPGASRFLDMLWRWDAAWYTSIAEHGYTWNSDPRTENPVVFFPAYPMLMRAGAWLTGAHAAYVGFVISMLAFTWAMAYVYRIAHDQFRLKSPEAVLAFIAWYPFAIFFGAVYTESLFLLALAAAFYHARERERLAAGAWALVASLAKPNGVFIAIPLAVMFGLRLSRDAAGWRVSWRDARILRAATGDAFVLAAPVAGLAAYSLYLWTLTGDPLAWLHGQQAWGRVFQGPLALLHGAQTRAADGILEAIMLTPTDVLNAAAALFALACVVPIHRRLGAPYALLVAIMVLPPLLAGGTTSMGRFTACLFPIFVWLGATVPASRRAAWCAAFAAGQAFAATLFFTWRHLF